MSTKWSDKEKELVHKLSKKNITDKEIAQTLKQKGSNRTIEAIKQLRKREKLSKPGSLIIQSKPKDSYKENIEKHLDVFDRIKEQRDALINFNEEYIIKPHKKRDYNYKVLCISDLHIPLENNAMIKSVVEKHSDADAIVVNGDILEMYSPSKWSKEKTILLRWEYEIALEYIKSFSNMFPLVKLVRGNHEDRLSKYFMDKVDPSFNFLVSSDILDKLADGFGFDDYGKFTKLYDFDNVVYDGGALGWYTKIGKTIFCHYGSAAGINARTAASQSVMRAADDFLEREEDFECIVQSHTHKISQAFKFNKLLIEQGCCCTPLGYESTPRRAINPPRYGYAVIYMDKDGHVDMENSRPYYYGKGYSTKNV